MSNLKIFDAVFGFGHYVSFTIGHWAGVEQRRRVGPGLAELVMARRLDWRDAGSAGHMPLSCSPFQAAGKRFLLMPLIDAGAEQGIALQVEHLSVIVGRDAHVPISMYGNPLRDGFRTSCHSDGVFRR